MRNNPILVDGGAAASRTAVQAFLAYGLVVALGLSDVWAMVAVPTLSGVFAVGLHLLTEAFPGLGKVFSAGFADGAARYLERK